MLKNDAIILNQIICKLKELKNKSENLNLCVEGSTSPFGPADKGSASVDIDKGDCIRFWSQSIAIDVQQGSALVNLEFDDPGIPSFERIIASNGDVFAISLEKITTFIQIDSGNATSTLDDSSDDGRIKYIVASNIGSGASINIAVTNGRDARGNVLNELILNTTGQSAKLIWDDYNGYWLILGSGVDIL